MTTTLYQQRANTAARVVAFLRLPTNSLPESIKASATSGSTHSTAKGCYIMRSKEETQHT